MARKLPLNNPVHQGWNILWFRSLNDWSQGDLEKKSGVPQREISDYEKTSVIPDDILQKFADAFKTDIMYLRDVATYGATENTYIYDNKQAVKGNYACQTIHPLETVKEMHETSTANLIEAHNKLTYTLEKQIEELKEQLRNK